ncbi:hypothetical protein HBP72_04775 [Listeria welshimeri]|nr:hypothetical protein [Listeria welshimeri]MBC1319134.1 hypothetical protein [Listeria welshimeri]MBC2345650.1 hypothetical protein [Listeria welshimeri]MBC2362023.1 hypothetical protein [Listeria welshimeri]
MQTCQEYYLNKKDGVTIVSKDGKLVTTWGKKDYDEGMKKIIEELYGK